MDSSLKATATGRRILSIWEAMFRNCSISVSRPFIAMLIAWLSVASSSPAQSAFDLGGKRVDPLSATSAKIVVLIFLRDDCPISSRYAPTIQQLSGRYKGDAEFWLVFPDREETSTDVRKYISDYGYELPALRDADHALVELAQAAITPEAAVFDKSRHLVYHGRIDNWYVEFGKPRPAPTTHELNDAIAAVLAGKPVSANAVKGVGCYISDLK